jgi:hypothetical protein
MVLYSSKIKSYLFKTLHCILLLTFSFSSFSQKIKKPITPKPYKSGTKEFVISYAISVKGDKIDGIAETYNGGLKTAFVKGDVARLRLVSLMRTQSIFFNNKKGNAKKIATVLKESGKERTKMFLTDKQWKVFNAKNDSTRCEFFKEDTIRILDFLCTKAILTAKDSSKLVIYFYPSVKNKTLAAAEPLFNIIPGLVMKYTYTKGEKAIEYTATSIKTGTIAPKSFIIPSKDYLVQKYNPGKAGEIGDMNAEDEEGTEEEEMETPVVDSTKTPVPTPAPKAPEVKPPLKS